MIKKDIVETEIRSVGFQKLQQDILESYKRLDEYRESVKRLQNEKQKLISAGKKESAEYKNIVKEIGLLNKAMDDEKKTRQSLMSGLKLTDMSYNQLKKRQTELRSELKATSESAAPQQYAKLRAELERVEQQMGKLSKGLKQVSQDMVKAPGVWGNAMSKVKNYLPAIGLGSVISSGFSKLTSFVSDSVGKFREYDEALVDAMKTTGQSKEGIKGISDELENIDTRTSQNDLLGLARVAGKLGIEGSDNIAGFVRAADKINVALAEDLGGNTEQAINEIGKLVDIFGLEDKFGIEDAMIRVGSAINESGASSTANEGYIVDFTKRVAGIAPNADIAIDSMIGLAATLDKYGQQSETSSTVYGQTINKMFTDPAKHAKLAGMGVKEFTNLLKTDANAAFVALLKGLRGNDAAMMDIANNLDDMSVKGARGVQVLGTLIKNVDELEVQQQLANKAFTEGTSVLDEYNTKNTSAEAEAEKITKQFTEQSVILGEKLAPVVNSTSTGLLYLTKIIVAIIGYLIESKGVIIAITVATVGYIAVKKMSLFFSNANAVAVLREVVAMNAATVAGNTYTLGQKALIAVKALLVGQFKVAAIAAKSFFMSLGPIGWAITAVTALVGAMALFGNETKKSSGFIGSMTAEMASEKSTLNDLTEALKSSAKGSQARATAIETINEKYKDYMPYLLSEQSTQEQISVALAAVNDELQNNIRLKYSKQERDRIATEQMDVEKGAVQGLIDMYQEYVKATPEQLKLAAAKFSDFMHGMKKGGQDGTDAVLGLGKFMRSIGVTSHFEFLKAQGYLLAISAAARDAKQALVIVDAMTGKPAEPAGGGDKPCAKCGKKPCECKKKCTVCSKDPCICGDKKSKKQWSLDGDDTFVKARSTMKQQRLDGEIATDEEYNRQLLALEVASLEARIATNKEKGDELFRLNDQLLDKRLQQAKTAKDKEAKLLDIANGGKSDTEQEKNRYNKQLQDLGLFNIKREDMNAKQLAAFEVLEKEHYKKLQTISDNAAKKTVTDLQATFDLEMSALRRRQAEELSLLTSASDIKEAKSRHEKEQQQLQYEQTEKLLNLYRAQLAKVNEQGAALGELMTEEDKQKLETIINDLVAEMQRLGIEMKKPLEDKSSSDTDIFGMTPDQWDDLFTNFGKGKDGLKDWGQAIQGVGAAVMETFSAVSGLMTSIEQREFKSYEKTQNKKKKALEKQLKAGTISQERYNERVQSIDEETEAKRLDMERKQAERQKMMAIFSAIINTAVAVVGALGSTPPGPWNIALAAIIGTLGAVQIAAIAAQPLPGAEKGGMLVERTQDGVRYNAEFEPHRRGKVDKPTVIVGENGTEYVVPAEGYNNPKVRPILNMIEQARLSGTLNTIDLPYMMAMQGLASGGYVKGSSVAVPVAQASPQVPYNYDTSDILIQLKMLLEKLNIQLESPIKASVTIAGDDGVAKNLNQFNALKKRATING